MADKRINALANTAPSTASDDFIAVDGTTNGTRKLSAFSPTFGGNATVTGTLTANGTITANSATGGILVNGAGITMDTDPVGSSASLRFVDGATPRFWIYKLSGDSNLYIRDMTNSRMQARFNPNTTSGTAITSFYSKVEIDATTASTTTSSGALVVGNGTSGGLGVGGAIVAGGTITSTASTDSGLLQLNLVNSSTGTSASSLFRFNAGTRTASLQAYNDTHATLAGQLRVSTSNGDIVLIPSGVTATTFGSSTVTVNHSTASTSTSTGALVVSGGVGVAGSIYAGATAKIGTATNYVWCGGLGDGAIHSYRTGADGYLRLTRGGVRDWDLFGGTNFTIAPDSGSAVLTLTSAGALTLGSSVQTSAPSGGTAAAWKLGTVASVSPTSPNRTIEVDIGGTIYYIHAKTTNN